MDIQNIRLNRPWNGKETIVLRQGDGFNFVESRFDQGIVSHDSFALLWRRDWPKESKHLALELLRNQIEMLEEEVAETSEDDSQ